MNALQRLEQERGLAGVLAAALKARDLYDDGVVCECDEPIVTGYALMCQQCLRENMDQRERRTRAMREPHEFQVRDRGSAGMCGFCSAWADDPRHNPRAPSERISQEAIDDLPSDDLRDSGHWAMGENYRR